jgi:phosphoribosylformylglycinamidine cyclo-ligase
LNPNSNSQSASYAAAGVDVTAGYEAVNRIKPLVASTVIPGVLGGIGDFGGMFEPNLKGMNRPVLVSGTDGVGTKLKLAFLLDKHDTVGIDCVAMCVNDIICSGASPMFFLDYIACGKNRPEKIAEIVSGIAEGCRQSECALIGGETAEMPGFYPENEYDLAGFSVGLVDYDKKITNAAMQEGDILLGLSSSGVHSNGYSLVRKVLDINNTFQQHSDDLGCTLGEELLKPTRIYVRSVKSLMECNIPIHGISHITGGGLYENVPRMMPQGLTAHINTASIPQKPIFSILQKAGNIPARDMYNTFNMGVGMILAIPKDQVGQAMNVLVQNGEQVSVIGHVKKGETGVEVLL